ncbi:MAG: YesL family protein [Blautia sp.]|nr:YesL family protein [Aeriscardovia sp.]MBQ1492045.1 YesL family protein [Blautia sp.]
MRNLFNHEGPVMVFLTKFAYTAWLNILWFVCSLPIFTLGAATTALYTVTLKMAADEEGNVTEQFFTAFGTNFKEATKAWLLLLLGGIVLAVDGYVLYHLRFDHAFWTVLFAVFIVMAAAYCFILLYVFPMIARFENTTFAMIKNALFVAMRFLICTAFLVVIHFSMLLVVVRFFTPAIIFGEGLVAYLSSLLLRGVLAQCEGKTEEDEKEQE